MVVPWLRWLVAALSPRRPGFDSKSVRVNFVVDKVAVGQVSLQVLRYSPPFLRTRLRTCCSYQPGNLPQNSVLSEIGGPRTEKYFHLS